MTTTRIGPLGLPALYEDGGKRITTHSMLKTYLRCPKQAQYKYAERLKQRSLTARDKPLKRGTWVHELLELYYRGEDWRSRHEQLTKKFNALFDDEKDELGDLPNECLTLMQSYLWHYGANRQDPHHGWKVIDTEVTFEAVWPDSEDGLDIYRCRLDALVEDDYGLLIVDHKTHARIPDHTARTLDAASPLYIWAARENGYDVRGFMWNYVRTKAPTKPKMVYVGTKRERLSTAVLDTDYLTYARALKEYEGSHNLNWRADPEVVATLRRLKAQRWQPGEPQTSPFFLRETLEKDDDMIARTVAKAMKTRDRMHNDFSDYEVIETSTDRSCGWCSFRQLCETEIFGGHSDIIRRKMYRIGDPLDYYNEIKDQAETV